MASRDEMLGKGYRYYCMVCNTVYKKIPRENYETGHGGRMRLCCKKCGDNLICSLADDKLVED
jgi:hypothetical protein